MSLDTFKLIYSSRLRMAAISVVHCGVVPLTQLFVSRHVTCRLARRQSARQCVAHNRSFYQLGVTLPASDDSADEWAPRHPRPSSDAAELPTLAFT